MTVFYLGYLDKKPLGFACWWDKIAEMVLLLESTLGRVRLVE
jgi:hypothetical protein